jgi:hypothetical protein
MSKDRIQQQRHLFLILIITEVLILSSILFYRSKPEKTYTPPAFSIVQQSILVGPVYAADVDPNGNPIPTGASSSNSASTNGQPIVLSLILRPNETDSYVMNTATAQAIGGGSDGGGTGPGVPPGTTDGHCAPTGAYPADLAADLKSKYPISLEGYGEAGIKNIYDLFTCLSTSKVKTLLATTDVTIHNADRPTEMGGGIGMGCTSRSCGIWIREDVGAFKFIMSHELGHVLYYQNLAEVMHYTDAANAYTTEGGLSPYSGGGNGCSALGKEEDYAEMVAFYLNPKTGGKTGACDTRDNPPNSLFGTDNFPDHLNVAKQVL